MNRKEFIKSCGMSCLTAIIAPAILESCGGTKYLTAPIEGDQLVIPLTTFEIVKEGSPTEFRKYIVAENEALQFPICVYRFSNEEYQALWMKCTHQGTELHVFGDRLQCPAHGSEFSNKGIVQNGPATDPLRTFSITVSETNLKINLK
jgi:Rieske Fe-S protein